MTHIDGVPRHYDSHASVDQYIDSLLAEYYMY